MPQLPLPLTLPESFSEESFFLSGCNRKAFDVVMNVGNWLGHALYLYGEKSSGKSHLANLWAVKTNATVIAGEMVDPSEIHGHCVFEDVEKVTNEDTLFHLYNHIRHLSSRLLLTSSCLPSELPFKLPDLNSRLRSCQLVKIDSPDDEIIATIMRKQFNDRQLLVDEEVIGYLVTRMERSFSAVKATVEIIDKHAMAERKNITIPFIKKLLGF